LIEKILHQYWNAAKMECRHNGMPQKWNAAIMECRNNGMPQKWNADYLTPMLTML
jgi:hypothetical protein